MSWEKEIEEVRRREALAQKMGGPDKVKRQHDGGKLTVRERVARLLDADSFHEIGGLAGVAHYHEGGLRDGELADFTPANLVMGRGRVAGPRVVEWTHGKFEKNELGGSHIHTRNGAVDDEAQSEDEAFERTRKFLSYLPNSVHELAARAPSDDDPRRADPWLIEAVPRDPRKVYNMRKIIASVVDRDSFFETGKLWGRPLITGFARLAGWPVALMAGDPAQYGGAWTARASEKVMRFVDLAQTFHLPVVHLVDCPGFLIGPEAEKEGTIRYGMAPAAAILQSTVPWCSVIVRKVFGVAGALHQNSSRYGMRMAWPSAEWGSLPIAGGLEAAYRAEIEAAPDPAAKRAGIAQRIRKFASPLRGAERYDIEEIIDPRDTRKLLCEFAELAAPLRTPGRSLFGIRP